ncbi:MAG: hypothetical protein ABSF78_08595 [Candidatus Acidiferrales bacterium]|jgi:hypothetical protein
MEEKYHLAVTVGYSFVIAVIDSVMRMSAPEHLALWVVGVSLFATVLWRIRKGADPRKEFELHP